MRTRAEIVADAQAIIKVTHGTDIGLGPLILEVLLDIRDLQAKHIRVTRTQSPAE